MRLTEISARTPAGAENYKPVMVREGVNVMMASHPLIRLLEFYDMVGDAEYVETENDATGGTGRQKGSNFTAGEEEREYATPALKIFGDSKTIDQAEQRRGKNMNNFSTRVLRRLSRGIGRNFVGRLIDGTASTTMWDGIATICPAGQKIALATNGAVFPRGNSDSNRAAQQAFFEALDEMIAMISGDVSALLVNSKLHSRITNVYKESFTFPHGETGVGKLLPYYNGTIPFVSMGKDGGKNEILPFTETQGTSNTCSSIYGVSLAEGDSLSIGSNTGFNVYYSKSDEKYRMTEEGDFVPTLFDDEAIAALTGIKVA